MILPERGLVREIIDRYFARRFIHPRIVSQVSGNEAIIALVHLGLGIGLVPKLVVQNSPLVNSVRFLPALSDLEPLSISLAVLETRQKLPVVRAFLVQAKEKI
jgi:LysR family positive regulator for ilvC